MKMLRVLTSLGYLVYALPVTCSQAGTGVDVYRGGTTPSDAGRINPGDPLITNGGNGGGAR